MRHEFSIKAILLAAAVFSLVSCARPPADPVIPVPETGMISVDHHSFQEEVINYPGTVLVLFHNRQFWQSVDMQKRIEWLAEQYQEEARFAVFEWRISDDPGRFRLEMLPTVILYRDGYEIDRIKGIPPGEDERRTWNDDLELWFLVNAMQLESGRYSGDFSYLFENDYTLKIGN